MGASMQIANVRYHDAAGAFIKATIDGQDWVVPDDMSNRHRQIIQEWVGAGGVVAPFVDTASPYRPLYPVDFKLGMLTLNVTPDMVDAAISQLDEPDRTRASIYWTSANMFYRDDVWLALIAGTFSKTDDDINAAWTYAMSLATPAVANS
jgi:hypothetical protein